MKNQDDQLNQLFKSLPREEADDYFTKRVSAHLSDGKKERSFSGMKLVLATTSAVAISAALVSFFLSGEGGTKFDPNKQALLDELADIQAEHTALATQAATLGETDSKLPVYYLGGNDRNDFVLDVAKIRLGDTDSNGLRTTPETNPNQNSKLRPGADPRAPAVYQGGSI